MCAKTKKEAMIKERRNETESIVRGLIFANEQILFDSFKIQVEQAKVKS